MKKFSKILALVLTFAMLLSISAFAANIQYAEGTNGKTITLSFGYTTKAANTAANQITTDIAEGTEFYVHWAFDGNDGNAQGMCNVDLPVGYNAEAVSMVADSQQDQLSGSYVNNFDFADGVMAVVWFNPNSTKYTQIDPATEEETVLYRTKGNIQRIKVKAKRNIPAAEIPSLFWVLSEATSRDGLSTCKLAIVDGQLPAKNYTVVAPEKVEYEVPSEPTYEDKDFFADVEANTANIVAEGVTYEEVAVFKASFDLKDLADKSAKEYGVAINNAKKAFAFEGEGTVNYVLAFYGVKAEEVGNINVDTYYTAEVEVVE